MKSAAQHTRFHVSISVLASASACFPDLPNEDVASKVGFMMEQIDEDSCFCGGDGLLSIQSVENLDIWKLMSEVVDAFTGKEDRCLIFYGKAIAFHTIYTY